MLSNSSSTSTGQLVNVCNKSKITLSIFCGMMSVKTILLLPLCIYIFYLAYQKWHRRHSFQLMSHSDLFTYHLAIMELFLVPGLICYSCGTYMENQILLIWGSSSLSFSYYGEGFFHSLTCVERYLAVVHPITYVGLRNTRGVRIRNISIGSVWILCFGLSGSTRNMTYNDVSILPLSVMFIFILTATFCSVAVLCVLVHPMTEDNGRENKQFYQSKLRAFYTITAISCVVWVWFGAMFVSYVLFLSVQIESICILNAIISSFNLPCSLMLPLLYLNKEGKLWRKGNDCDQS